MAELTTLTSRMIFPPVQSFRLEGGVGIRLTGTVEDARIGPLFLNGAEHVVYCGDVEHVRNLIIEGLIAVEIQREGIRLKNAEDVSIRDFDLRMREQPQVGSKLPSGVFLVSGRNITLDNGFVSGFRSEYVEGAYTNGDGILAEGAVDTLVIRNVASMNNSDAGFDLKSTNTLLDDCQAYGNKRNFRFWTSIRATKLTVGNARNACIWIKGTTEGLYIEIDHLVVDLTEPTTCFMIETGIATVRIGRLTVLNWAAGSKWLQRDNRNSRVILPDGVTPPQ